MLVSTTTCSYPMVSSVLCEDRLYYVVVEVSGEIVEIDAILNVFGDRRVSITTVV